METDGRAADVWDFAEAMARELRMAGYPATVAPAGGRLNVTIRGPRHEAIFSVPTSRMSDREAWTSQARFSMVNADPCREGMRLVATGRAYDPFAAQREAERMVADERDGIVRAVGAAHDLVTASAARDEPDERC